MTVILGGGISGLSAAYYALENPKLGALTLLEASNRLGGWIRSERSERGIIFEKGPRTIRFQATAESVLDLIDHLGLTDNIIPITSSNPASRNRLIYVNNELHSMPNSFGGFFKILSPLKRPLITACWNDFKAPRIEKDDESIYSFFERRLGKDIADYYASPAICGIFAGDAHKISIRAIMPALLEWEQRYGSIMKGVIRNLPVFKKNDNISMKPRTEKSVDSFGRGNFENWRIWSLQNGLEELPKRLAEYLKEHHVKIELKNKCSNITFKSNGVELQVNGETKKCSRVISCLSSKNLAPMIEKQHPQLANELHAIPYVTVAVINLHYNRDVLSLNAFGFLVPPSENIPILGVIFDSCVLKQGESTVLTVMMGGEWFEHYFGQNPTKDELLSIALENLKTILHITDDPDEVDVAILKDCIPQHIVGHKQRIQRINNYISSHNIPLSLCGASFHGVGINDIILSAKQAIHNISSNEDEQMRDDN